MVSYAVAVGGLVVGVLGFVSACVAPKGSGSGDPDDDAVPGWTAIMFLGGCALALAAMLGGRLAESQGWPDPVGLAVVLGGCALLAAWGWGVYRLTHRT
jgi:MFS family permease